jgi:DNA polymerase III alpha subunit
MSKVLPLFKSHYSIGKSILTLEKAGESEADAPDSIVDIAKENDLKEVFLVEDSFGGFLESFKNLKAQKIQLNFGLRFSTVSEMTEKTEASLKKEHKVIILARNRAGYQKLIKLYSKASQEGFYYQPRLDFEAIKSVWSEDLELCIPFYDSFLFSNSFILGASCIPDFSFTKPVFFLDYNDLPFDDYLRDAVVKFTSGKYDTLETKSIYYKKKKDFKAYLTRRCIDNRTSLNKPNLEHMSSNEFCVEAWKEKNA